MTQPDSVSGIMDRWWNQLRTYSQNNGLPAKGTVAGALVVLERLRMNFVLDMKEHLTKGGTQIAGAGKAATQRILVRYGEDRSFLEEAGRTNRGLIREVTQLLDALRAAGLGALELSERDALLTESQLWLVQRVGEYFNRQRVTFVYTPENSTWQAIHEILEQARLVGKEGPVAQYLVGAKLTLRLPNTDIRNDTYSTSDLQSGMPGDFLVRKTVFHVTVAPTTGHYEKCVANLSQGYRPYLIVPDRVLVGTRQNAESVAPGRISVRSIEDFVSQNLDELFALSEGDLIGGFRQLLEVYNERVDMVETDKSLLIEIPRNLLD